MKSNISQARISQQIRTLRKQNLSYLKAQPLDDDIYTWHFTFLGPQNSDFHQGLYHGQILLPFQYPFKPPDIIFMNKNGRFQVNTKICLTITQYHPQQWNSAWTIRTMLQAVISLFTQNIQGVGYEQSSSESRRYMAKQSHNFTCEKCGVLKNILKPRQQQKNQTSKKPQKQQKQYIKLQQGNYQYAPQPIRKKSQEPLNFSLRNVKSNNSQILNNLINRGGQFKKNHKSQTNTFLQTENQGQQKERLKNQGKMQNTTQNYNYRQKLNNFNDKEKYSSNYHVSQSTVTKDIFHLNSKIFRNRQRVKDILANGTWLSKKTK